MTELSTIQANIIGLIGVVVSLVVGLAVIDGQTGQIIVSAAGTIVSLGFSLFAELRTKTVVQAKAAQVTIKGVR